MDSICSKQESKGGHYQWTLMGAMCVSNLLCMLEFWSHTGMLNTGRSLKTRCALEYHKPESIRLS